MVSNKLAAVMILACCGFLIWYLLFRDKSPKVPEKITEKEVVQPVTNPSETGEDGATGEPVEEEGRALTTVSDPVVSAETADKGAVPQPEKIRDVSSAAVETDQGRTKDDGGYAPPRRTEQTAAAEEEQTVAVKTGDGATWNSFREKYMPEYRRRLNKIFEREATLDVDWNSLGNLEENPRLSENLLWELNTLSKALSDPLRPKKGPGGREDKIKIREGVDKIVLRRVDELANRRLEVAGNVMQMDLFWGRYGSFSAFDIETLLLDRNRTRFSSQVNEPAAALPPLMIETCRNRLPSIFRRLNLTMGGVVPVQMDWPGLGTAPDAPHRLVYMLDILNRTLKGLVNTDSGFGSYSNRERSLKKQRDEQRSAIVKNNLTVLKVRGGSYLTDPVVQFSEDSIELVVYQDTTYIRNPDADAGKQRAVGEIRRFPQCNRRGLEKIFVNALNLEVGPALQQAKVVHFPITQAYFPEFLNEQVGKARLPVPEAVALREVLETHPITLALDWDGLVAPEKPEDRMTSIRKVETGKYNYNDKYGELFKDFFYAVAEAVRKDKSFLKRFIHVVRTVRFEPIADPELKELYSSGSTIVLRQCLYRQKGTFGYEVLSQKLSVEVAAMAHAPSREDMAAFTDLDDCLAGIEETLEKAGVQISITTDGALSADPQTVEETCRRLLVPFNGALRYLLVQPGYLRVFRENVLAMQFRKAVSAEKKGCSFQDGVLRCAGLPGTGVKGWLPGDELTGAVDDAVALKVRAKVERLENSRASRRTNSLTKHGWDVAVEVDWESFINHPEEGGNRLYPIYVEQYGTERLIYALSGWMEDAAFKEKVMQRIARIRVVSAANAQSSNLSVENDALVYRCFADISARGYLSMEDLQQQLYRLIIKTGD